MNFVKAKMDMGRYFFTQPNPTNQPRDHWTSAFKSVWPKIQLNSTLFQTNNDQQ